ncbi:MAG: Wzz/FepE/Etk N-terminal domain-containing protein [Cyanobacteria bacterium P01_A01_bin.15]
MRADTVLPSYNGSTNGKTNGPAQDQFLVEDQGGFNVGALIKTLQRKWWIIAGITVVTTGLSAVKVLNEKPIYTDTFEILAQDQSTETEVISNVPETLASQEQVTVNRDLLKILTGPKVLQPVVEGVRDRYPDYCPPVSTNPDLLEASYDPCYQVLADRLRVNTLGKDSDILQVTFQDLDPQIVQVVLTLVSEAYLTYSLESKQADIRRALEFVQQKLPDLENKVDSLQDQLQALRLNYDLIDPESRGAQLSGQVTAFSQQQLDLQIELEQNRATYENLRSQLSGPQEQASSSALAQNPRYQTLLDTLLALDTEIAEASTLYLDASPDMEVLKEQRRNVLTLLEQQGAQSQRDLVSQMQALETQEGSLNRTLQGLSVDVDELSDISRRYVDIQRGLEIETENLNQFLAKQAALEIDAAQREIPWEVVTPSTNPTPQAISFLQNLLLGGTLGLLLGAAIVLLLDRSTGVLYSEQDIQRAMKLPILGKIPDADAVEQAILTSAQSLQLANGAVENPDRASLNGAVNDLPAHDPFMEAFRSLYTNLRLNSVDQLQSVVVSSVMDDEGKSVTAIHLAKAAALLGQRVLLVDTNLRDPKIHRYLDLPNDYGLTELALNDASALAKNTFLHEISNGLMVLCAGQKCHDAGHTLTSKRVQRIIQQLKTKFDLIVFDTPSLLGQTDAYLVAEQVDGMLIVARPGQIKQQSLDQAMGQIRIANINVFGLAIRES